MVFAETTKTSEATLTMNDAVNILQTKLNEAIDDMEDGRVQTLDEAWKKIDKV